MAGYDTEKLCIRPMLPPPGIFEQSLVVNKQPLVFPWAVIELDLIRPMPQPPHTEDYLYDPTSLRFERALKDEKKQREILGWSLFDNAQDIFEQEITDNKGFYVRDSIGPRSTGTLLPSFIKEVVYKQDAENKFSYRLVFKDKSRWFNLKITDLTFNTYSHSLRGLGRDPDDIALDLTKLIKTRRTFIRIGLSRGWKDRPGLCFLQINAIYTFPDYLQGKTFGDFK